MVAVLAGFVGIVVPATAKQTSEIFRNFSQAESQMQRSAPTQTPWVRALITRLLAMREAPQKSSIKAPLMFSLNAVEGVTAFLFVLVLTLYLLLDGKRLYAWLVSYVPPRHRDKLVRTTPDVKRVVAAYIRGQAITCFICGFYVFGVLTALRIPASVPLALLAFVADLLPVVGTILMTLPAVLLALTVSPVRAGIVLVAYLFYHLVESYVIIPRVYGHQMRLSTLTVLLAVAIGGYLQGAAGAVLILPFVALFPAVEQIWLREYLPEEAPQEHERLDRAEDDRSRVDRIADEIIEKTDDH
jgi:predicted PurR-regulated permease PerM